MTPFSGRFHGFQDRDVYLRRVKTELLLKLGQDPVRYSMLEQEDGLCDVKEGDRRNNLLLCLQTVLQSRRLKLRMLREQLYGSKNVDSLIDEEQRPIHKLQAEASESTSILQRCWNDPYGRSSFSCEAIRRTLRHDYRLQKTDDPESIFGISTDPSHHIYPARALQTLFAEPESRLKSFFPEWKATTKEGFNWVNRSGFMKWVGVRR